MDGSHSAVGHAQFHVVQCNLDACVAFVVTNGIAGIPVSQNTLVLNVDVFHFAFLDKMVRMAGSAPATSSPPDWRSTG